MKYYKTSLDGQTIIYFENNGFRVSFTENSENTDYQAYLAWCAEGNTPLPADGE